MAHISAVNNESSDETGWHSCCLHFAHERFSNGMAPIKRRRISPYATVFVSGLHLNHVFHQFSRNSFLEGVVPVKPHCLQEIDSSVSLKRSPSQHLQWSRQCKYLVIKVHTIQLFESCLRKPVFGIANLVRHKLGCAVI